MHSEFSAQSNAAIQSARDECVRLKQYYVGVEHLFLGLCDAASPPFRDILRKLAVEPTVILRIREQMILEGEAPPWGSSVIQTPRFERILQTAGKLCARKKRPCVSPYHLFLAILAEANCLPVRLCSQAGVDLEKLTGAVEQLAETDLWSEAAAAPKTGKTPNLERFGRDLTWLASTQRLGPTIGRDRELEDLILILRKKTAKNALVIGEAGTGKTQLIEGLATEIVGPRLEGARALQGMRIIEIDLNAIVAGTMYRGDLEARLDAIVREAKEPDVILFIDEFHLIIDSGASVGSPGAAQVLKPYLARGEIRCIGSTTTAEYGAFVEGDKAFARRFETVQLREPDGKETLEILKGLAGVYEKHHKVQVEEDALRACVDFGKRYMPLRCFPEKAVGLLDLACAQASGGLEERAVVRQQDIARVIFQKTGVRPLADSDVKEFLGGLAIRLNRRVIGQPEVIETVVNVIRNSQMGLTRPNRPQGVFLLCGSSGVGKTELVRAVADELFPAGDRLLHFNMSEYTDSISVSALLGAPPAYVGHEAGGALTEAVRSAQFAVVLFDEIEKAHPEVCKLLLRVFEEGRIIDRSRRIADFTNTFIFMTSNLGADELSNRARPGFSAAQTDSADGTYARLTAAARSAVEKTFSSEFRNRIDETLVFRPLTGVVLREIIDKEVTEINLAVGIRQYGVSVKLHESAYTEIVRSGYSIQYGARELRRAIERLVLRPLGGYLAAGNVPQHSSVIIVAEGGQLQFRIEASAA